MSFIHTKSVDTKEITDRYSSALVSTGNGRGGGRKSVNRMLLQAHLDYRIWLVS